jgi:hypothetical protein
MSCGNEGFGIGLEAGWEIDRYIDGVIERGGTGICTRIASRSETAFIDLSG